MSPESNVQPSNEKFDLDSATGIEKFTTYYGSEALKYRKLTLKYQSFKYASAPFLILAIWLASGSKGVLFYLVVVLAFVTLTIPMVMYWVWRRKELASIEHFYGLDTGSGAKLKAPAMVPFVSDAFYFQWCATNKLAPRV